MPTTSRKAWFLLPAAFAAGGVIAVAANWWPGGAEPGQAAAAEVTVYKTEACGCCNDWVDHLREAGIPVSAHDVSQNLLNEKKRAAGMSFDHASCHTAYVEGYVIEGHVPAADIRRFLKERPDAAGLTVPGMPVGSPGMEHGDRRDPYDVLVFDRDGNTGVYASYHR